MQIRDRIEQSHDKHKYYADKHLKASEQYKPGDHVWVTLHPISLKKSNKATKCMPRHNGPYVILKQKSPTSYTIATKENSFSPSGNYHISALCPYTQDDGGCSKGFISPRGRPGMQPNATIKYLLIISANPPSVSADIMQFDLMILFL